jgi:TPR repeat protein
LSTYGPAQPGTVTELPRNAPVVTDARAASYSLLTFALWSTSGSSVAATSDDIAALTSKATGGDAAAALELGRRFSSGDGVAKDPAQAARWIEQSAATGNTIAQSVLGQFFGMGVGVPSDPVRSFSWHQKAAIAGIAASQYQTGLMYSQGIGIDADDGEAFHWIRQAASKDHVLAMAITGLFLADGRGTERNVKEAVRWLRRPAATRVAFAQHALANLYWLGGDIKAKRSACITRPRSRATLRHDKLWVISITPGTT